MTPKHEYLCRSCGHEWSSADMEQYCYKCGSIEITVDGRDVEHKPRLPVWARIVSPVAKPMLKGIQKLDEKTTKFWKEMEEKK